MNQREKQLKEAYLNSKPKNKSNNVGNIVQV
jgi:hypothetical protein